MASAFTWNATGRQMTPQTVAKIAAMGWTCQQFTFYMYHYNSFAANPLFLRSPKPMIMRDFFLTKGSPDELWHVANPLTGVYVLSLREAIANASIGWLVGFRLVETIGFRHTLAIFSLGSIFSSFAYVFQMQASRTKKSTEFDCSATSTGACAALCAAAILIIPTAVNQGGKKAQYLLNVPSTKTLRVMPFAFAYLVYAMVDEHVLQTSSFGTSSFQSGMGNIWSSNSTKGDGSSISAMGSRLFVRSPEDVQDLSSRRSGEIKDITNEIQLSNWGCIGGIFLGLIYASVVFRTKTDMVMMKRFWGNIPNSGVPKGATPMSNPAYRSATSSISGKDVPIINNNNVASQGGKVSHVPPPPTWGKK